MSDRKLRYIRSILRNELWTSDSSLYQLLEAALTRLSAAVLADLDAVINQKEIEASRRAQDKQARLEGVREMEAASYGPTPLG